MFEIRIYSDPILRTTAKPVTRFDEEFRSFVEEMTVTMREKDGVGLAAVQVGRPVSVAIVDPSAGEREPLVLINPAVISASKEMVAEEEGCLSIPTIRDTIERHARVSVRALDINGKEYTIDDAEGLAARAFQHEIDHLNGILFIDHLSPLRRKLISGKLRKLAKSGGETG